MVGPMTQGKLSGSVRFSLPATLVRQPVADDLVEAVGAGRREAGGGRVVTVGTQGRRGFDPRGFAEAGEVAFDARAQRRREVLGEVSALSADRALPAGAV